MIRNKKFNIERSNINRWKFVILGIVIMMFLGTVYSYSVFRLPIEKQFDIGSAESGLPYMMALAFYALFMFLTGRYLERFHPRKILMVGGVLVMLGWILSSFATNIMLLTFTYGCISGAGVGIAYGVPMTVVAKWFPEKKGLAVGMVLVGFGMSPLVTAPIARILIENYSVTSTFLILGICFGIILPILAYSFRYPTREESIDANNQKVAISSSADFSTSDMVKSKSFKGLYLNFIIGTMIGLTLIGMTTSIGVDYIGTRAIKVTGLITIFAIFNGCGRPLFGWFTDRFGTKAAMLLSYFMITVAAILLILFGENNIIIYIISFSAFWFNLGGWLAIAPASTLRLYGMKNYGQNYGLVFTAYGIGAITGVSTSGLLLDFLGNYKFIFYYVIALCLLGFVITLFMIQKSSSRIRNTK